MTRETTFARHGYGDSNQNARVSVGWRRGSEVLQSSHQQPDRPDRALVHLAYVCRWRIFNSKFFLPHGRVIPNQMTLRTAGCENMAGQFLMMCESEAWLYTNLKYTKTTVY